jgi:hypothetical protein
LAVIQYNDDYVLLGFTPRLVNLGLTMFKLEVQYTDKSTEEKYFTTWTEADWYVHMGGDHVADYTITEVTQ